MVSRAIIAIASIILGFVISSLVTRFKSEKEAHACAHNQGEMMEEIEQGSIPAEDMGVAFTLVSVDGEVYHYDCGSCRQAGEVSGIAADLPGLGQVLLDHARMHGYSSWTMLAVPDPPATIDIVFKRVTVIRDAGGNHKYECNGCLMVMPQGCFQSHISLAHPGSEFTVDHEPAHDSLGFKSGIPKEGRKVPVTTYLEDGKKTIGEATVFPDGRATFTLDHTPEFLKRELGDVSFAPLKTFTEYFKKHPGGLERDLGFPAKLKNLGEEAIIPPVRPKLNIEDLIVSNALESRHRFIEANLPEGFKGTLVAKRTPFIETYGLIGEDGQPVAFKDGTYEMNAEPEEL